MSKNITLDLKPRKDEDGEVFYVAKVKAPVLIDCSQGVVFLVFTADPGAEQLQIALMDNRGKDD